MNMERKITAVVESLLLPTFYSLGKSDSTLCDYLRMWEATFETSYRDAILKIGSWILLDLSKEQVLSLAEQTFTKKPPYNERFEFMLRLLCEDAGPGYSLSSYEKQPWFDLELVYMLQAD